ncbi:ABC transporter substrate-binding protein [Teichococcus vastitatis]|uniref:ABC transporter substrate-binding protein n=1 Tax=Teichococcus vastitatis TaxID=2307076 RepID=UPI0034636947
MGRGPFRFLADERNRGARLVYARHEGYLPRAEGVPSFTAGPRVAHFACVVFNVIPDASTAVSALMSGAADWVMQPLIDLLPMFRRICDLVVKVKDATGTINCLRFNHLLPPLNRAAMRRVLLDAIIQSDWRPATRASAS